MQNGNWKVSNAKSLERSWFSGPFYRVHRVPHFAVVISQVTMISLEQPRNAEPTGDLFHFLGHHLLGFPEGLIHGRYN